MQVAKVDKVGTMKNKLFATVHRVDRVNKIFKVKCNQ